MKLVSSTGEFTNTLCCLLEMLQMLLTYNLRLDYDLLVHALVSEIQF